MTSITKTTPDATASGTIYDQVIKGIRDLGFPVVMSIALLYNGWSTQNYLMATSEKRDVQMSAMADAITKLAQTQNDLQKIGGDNNAMLRSITTEMQIQKFMRETRKGKSANADKDE